MYLYPVVFRGECTEACKARRREVENELKQIRRELKLREDQTKQLERETQVYVVPAKV